MQRLVLVLVVLALAATAVLLWSPWAEDGLTPSGSPAGQAAPDVEFEAAGAASVGGREVPEAQDGATREAAPDQEDEAETREIVVDAANGRVTGRVVDSDGRPVAGVDVWLARDLGFFDPQAFSNGGLAGGPFASQLRRRTAGTTDAAGAFELVAPLRDKKLALYAFGSGFAPAHAKVAARNGATIAAGDLVVERGIVVRGRVVNAAGRPVEDAAITVRMDSMVFFGSNGRRGPNRTDAQGAFEVLVTKPGDFRIIARHEGYPEATHKGKAERRGDVIEGVLIQLSAGAQIAGVVDGLPEAKQRLEIRAAKSQPRSTSGADGRTFEFSTPLQFADKRTPVDEDGKFVLAGLEPGANYRLAVFERKGERAYNARRFSADATAAAGTRGVHITYDQGVVLQLRPVDARTGAALEEVSAAVSFEGRGAHVDMIDLASNRGNKKIKVGDDGIARLEPVRAAGQSRRLTVTIKASGYAEIERKGIELGTQPTIDLGTLRFQPAPTLRVTVTNADGEPIKDANVSFQPERPNSSASTVRSRVITASAGDLGGVFSTAGPSTQVRTDREGVAELTIRGDSLAGKVRIRHSKYAPTSVPDVVVKPIGVTEQAAKMYVGGRIVATLVDAGGAPIAGERVRYRSKASGSSAAETDVSGQAEFDHLAPGEYFLSHAGKSRHGSFVFDVAVQGGPSGPQQPEGQRVMVDDGKTTEVTVVKPATATLVGTVTADGAPLAKAMVRIAGGSNEHMPDSVLEQLSEMGALGGNAKFARTNADGEYELKDVEAGEVELVISHKSRAMAARRKVQVVAGETRQDFALRTTRLQGRVVDEQGKPVAGARISVRRGDAAGPRRMSVAFGMVGDSGGASANLSGGRKPVVTDRDGRFEIVGVAGGVRLVVDARSDRYADASSDPVSVPEGGTQSGIEIKTGVGGKLVVHANVDGFGVVTARLEGANGSPKSGMLRNGKAELSGLAAGRWTVTVREPMNQGAEPKERTVEVRGGETATVRF